MNYMAPLPVRPKRIQECEKNRAVTMWANGCDTWAIARNLEVEEWRIYNNLPKWRNGE